MKSQSSKTAALAAIEADLASFEDIWLADYRKASRGLPRAISIGPTPTQWAEVANVARNAADLNEAFARLFNSAGGIAADNADLWKDEISPRRTFGGRLREIVEEQTGQTEFAARIIRIAEAGSAAARAHASERR
jgi:hypothetical protein